MPDTLNILNRYLSLFRTNAKSAFSELQYEIRLTYGDNAILFKLDGQLGHNWSDANQQYLVQYAGSKAQQTKRTNPKSSHSYSYMARVFAFLSPFGKDSHFNFWPEYYVKKSYTNSSDMYYDLAADTIAGEYDLLRTEEKLERYASILDPRNSYDYTQHNLEQSTCLFWIYEKRTPDEHGRDYSRIQFNLSPTLTYLRRSMIFRGFDRQNISKNSLLPDIDFMARIVPPGARQDLRLHYNFFMTQPDMMDLINVHFNSDPLNQTMGNPGLKNSFSHKVRFTYRPMKGFWGWFFPTLDFSYTFRQNSVTYGTTYDLATGVRTTQPFNISGNREGSFMVILRANSTKFKGFSVVNVTNFSPTRYVTLIGDDSGNGLQRSISHREYWSDQISVQYNKDKFSVALVADVNVNHAVSRTGDFDPYTLTNFRYGVRGLVRLPWNIEISTNLRMYSWRGYSEPSQNTDRLIWNATISKSILKGALRFALEGYDMLCQSRNLTSNVTASYRQETRFRHIPNYFMFSISYNFARKMKQ